MTTTAQARVRLTPARQRAAANIYDHEVALHAARASGVRGWVAAAEATLHAALEAERQLYTSDEQNR